MAGSSTLMLPLLLLPLFISFYLSSSAPSDTCKSMKEFHACVDRLKNGVKDCENCSSIHITDRCKCFNLTASIGKFPDYFTNGLKSLNHSISSQEHINKLIWRLELMVPWCKEKINFTSLSVKYEPVISPADLHQKLKDLAQQIDNILQP